MPAIQALYHARTGVLKSYGAPRSEKREAFCLVAQVMLAKMDLVTKRVGSRPDAENRVKGALDQTLADESGVSLRRVRRIIHFGRIVGLWSSSRTWELDEKDGGHRGRASVRCFLMKFFRLIRRNLAIDYAVSLRCSSQARKKAAAAAAAAAAAPETIPREAIRMSTRRIARGHRRPPAAPPAPASTPEPITVDAQRWAEMSLRVRQQHPEWSASDVWKEVERLIAAARA